MPASLEYERLGGDSFLLLFAEGGSVPGLEWQRVLGAHPSQVWLKVRGGKKQSGEARWGRSGRRAGRRDKEISEAGLRWTLLFPSIFCLLPGLT